MPDNATPQPPTEAEMNVRLMEPAEMDLLSSLLADATPVRSVDAARTEMEAHHGSSGSAIFVITLDDDPIGAYIMAAARMSVEIILFAVRADMRRRGIL